MSPSTSVFTVVFVRSRGENWFRRRGCLDVGRRSRRQGSWALYAALRCLLLTNDVIMKQGCPSKARTDPHLVYEKGDWCTQGILIVGHEAPQSWSSVNSRVDAVVTEAEQYRTFEHQVYDIPKGNLHDLHHHHTDESGAIDNGFVR